MLIKYRVSRTPLLMYGQDLCDEATPYVLEAVRFFLGYILGLKKAVGTKDVKEGYNCIDSSI